jgi:putative sigma-54 modulation protein
MKISITFRHTEPENTLKEYVNDKIDRLTRLVHKPLEAHVVLTEEKHNRTADVTLSAKNLTARGEVTTDDFFASIDGAINKVENALKRFKGRKTSGKGRGADKGPLTMAGGEYSSS